MQGRRRLQGSFQPLPRQIIPDAVRFSCAFGAPNYNGLSPVSRGGGQTGSSLGRRKNRGKPQPHASAGARSASLDAARSKRDPLRQKVNCSFDHLVGAHEQRRRHVAAERLGSLEVANGDGLRAGDAERKESDAVFSRVAGNAVSAPSPKGQHRRQLRISI
jgi:hypothetical protein